MVRPLSLVLSGLVPVIILVASLFNSADPPKPDPLAGSEKTVAKVPSGNHSVPITIYRPLAATIDDPVPVILHSHGWAGSRTNATDAFALFTNAGFAVVSIDMRGHGEARMTSEARVHHMDFEIPDVRAVIDFLSGLPWVQLDRPGDPRVGAIGGSYGGGYQLLTAAVDDKLDAIVPEITWNDLTQSLVPNGAPKSAWVDLLYAGGNANARLHPTIHEGFTYVQTANRLPDGSVPGTTDLKSQFLESSPTTYPGRIRIPTLLVQGMPDTLFNFNEAAANYALIRAAGAPVSLVTHLRGHILNTQGTIPIPAPVPVGAQPPAGPTPCGAYDALALAWFQTHLQRGRPAKVPDVCLALDDGTSITGKSYPLPGGAIVSYPLPGGQGLTQGGAGGNATWNVAAVNASLVIAGIPHLSGSLQSTAPDTIVYWKIVVREGRTGAERVVDSQVTPVRLSGDALATQTFSVDLGGIATRLQPGDTLKLVASTWDAQFAHNAAREPGAIVVGNLELDVPIVRETPGSGR